MLLAAGTLGRPGMVMMSPQTATAICLPVLAGYLFDTTRSYGAAVPIAVGANVTGMAMALTMPRPGGRRV